MFFRIPGEFIIPMEERYDLDFLSDGYRSTDSVDDYEDEYADADEEYFESVKE